MVASARVLMVIVRIIINITFPGDPFLNDPPDRQKTGVTIETSLLTKPTTDSCSSCDFRAVCTDSCAGDHWGPRSRFWARVDKERRSGSLSSRHC